MKILTELRDATLSFMWLGGFVLLFLSFWVGLIVCMIAAEWQNRIEGF